jgi:hypothetical protein
MAALRLWPLCLTIFVSPHVAATNYYVSISLPKGVQIELPKNWEALSNKQRINLGAYSQAKVESLGLDTSSELDFAANYYDDRNQAAGIVNVRYYPDLAVSQADARAASVSDIRELDTQLRQGMDQGFSGTGVRILNWKGTKKQVIHGNTVFITEYKRSPMQDNRNFIVRLVRMFNMGKSFTVTISYREDHEYLLRPITDRIIASIRLH